MNLGLKLIFFVRLTVCVLKTKTALVQNHLHYTLQTKLHACLPVLMKTNNVRNNILKHMFQSIENVGRLNSLVSISQKPVAKSKY